MTEREDPKKTKTARYIEKDGKRLRCGFTTGSCAAAAAAAAARILLTGESVQEAEIRTPGGPVFRAQILEQKICYEEDQDPLYPCRFVLREREDGSYSLAGDYVSDSIVAYDYVTH